jgi:hypothetical protein
MNLRDLQQAHNSSRRAFNKRGRKRQKQADNLREAFQSGELKVKAFRHETREILSAQLADERNTGFRFACFSQL